MKNIIHDNMLSLKLCKCEIIFCHFVSTPDEPIHDFGEIVASHTTHTTAWHTHARAQQWWCGRLSCSNNVSKYGKMW